MDSEVVKVAESVFKKIVNIKELLIEFGIGKHQRMFPVFSTHSAGIYLVVMQSQVVIPCSRQSVDGLHK